jgi:hypothetical protein
MEKSVFCFICVHLRSSAANFFLLEHFSGGEIAGLHDRNPGGVDVFAESRVDLRGCERGDFSFQIGVPL